MPMFRIRSFGVNPLEHERQQLISTWDTHTHQTHRTQLHTAGYVTAHTCFTALCPGLSRCRCVRADAALRSRILSFCRCVWVCVSVCLPWCHTRAQSHADRLLVKQLPVYGEPRGTKLDSETRFVKLRNLSESLALIQWFGACKCEPMNQFLYMIFLFFPSFIHL